MMGTTTNISLYIFTFASSLILSLILTPAARSAAIIFKIIDHPSTTVKTHKEPVPYLGGGAIFTAFAFSLFWIRVLTSFPTGTLRSLRGILLGGFLIFLMGLIDDIKHGGLNYRTKFVIQIIAASLVMIFGVHIKFIQPTWFALLLTIVWIVGITNAFNIIDIMDGLSSGVAIMAACAFLFISLPTEEIYVNFMAAALAGAAMGFFPYNVSKNWRIFMGDSGSLFLGFVTSSLALGTSYSKKSDLGVFAPLLILALPIFDTLLVFWLRLRKGVSPFLGSKDHFPLRMEQLGWHRRTILIFSLLLTLIFCAGAAFLTRVNIKIGIYIGIFYLISLILFTKYLLKAKNQ